MAIDASGTVAVAGAPPARLDGNTTTAGFADGFLVKYDSAGQKQWITTIRIEGLADVWRGD